MTAPDGIDRGPAAIPPPAALIVCRTCPRDAPPADEDHDRGRRLAQRVDDAVRQSGLHGRVRVRVVSCLNGCLRPANVALRGPGRWRHRFGDVQVEDTEALLAFVDRYLEDPTGDVSVEGQVGPLSDRVHTRVPPPGRH